MLYRPIISVYINRHIADIGYYRNWDDTDLVFEAIAIAALSGERKEIKNQPPRKGWLEGHYTH